MDIILKSLAAAVVTAIILLMAKFSSPKLAGAIGGIPIVFAISYVFITFSNKSLARDFLLGGGIWGDCGYIFQPSFNFFKQQIFRQPLA